LRRNPLQRRPLKLPRRKLRSDDADQPTRRTCSWSFGPGAARLVLAYPADAQKMAQFSSVISCFGLALCEPPQLSCRPCPRAFEARTY
jgi:hypothetical protein